MPKRYCQKCGIEILNTNNKYCSWTCYRPIQPTIECKRCGKVIQRGQEGHINGQYCSMDCYKPKRKDKICKYCGNIFNKPGNTIYCSSECYHLSQIGKKRKEKSGKITINCKTCGKMLLIYPSSNRKFCGDECFYKWLNGAHWSPTIERACPICGKWFIVLVSRANETRQRSGIYCSKKCHNESKVGHYYRERIKHIQCHCMNCGREFTKYPSQIKAGRGKFCSRSCSAAYYYKIVAKSPTSIEKALMDELDSRGVKYEFQYPLGSYILDFAFPEYKLAVETDGVYWHNLENVIKKDNRKNSYLNNLGWHVIRLDEDSINASVSGCVDIVLNYLQSPAITKHPRILRSRLMLPKD